MNEPKPQEVMWNLSHTRVGGDVGGLIFVIGTVVTLLIGIPPFKWFLAVAFAGGAVCAFALSFWHRRHPSPQRPPNTIDGHGA